MGGRVVDDLSSSLSLSLGALGETCDLGPCLSLLFKDTPSENSREKQNQRNYKEKMNHLCPKLDVSVGQSRRIKSRL